MALTRRALLEQVGWIGGVGAAYLAMEAIGLAMPTPVGAETFALPPGTGNGKSVVILGAGIAGLVSAYELQRAGHKVTVLEARNRIGGRSWTIRGGDRIEQIGRPDQLATFDKGLYFNSGPARIPATHRVILGYAKRFGVPMETFVNVNRSARWDFGGKVEPERRMVNDMRGRISELLAKAIDRRALDQAVTKDELDAIRQFLPAYGSLDAKGAYLPTGRNGFSIEPGGYDQAPVALPALDWKALLPSPAVALPYLFEQIPDMQATMLQPVGGMDRIAHAIYERVKPAVRLRTPITAIRRIGDRVRIEHGSAATEADFCVCTLPMPVLARIPGDFSAAKKAALTSVPYLHSVKLAYEAPRFWEADQGIYGGNAWTDRLNENVMYPSHGFNDPKGVLIAGYCAGWTHQDTPDSFAALSHEERFRIARDSVEALHPGRSKLLTKGVTVAWGLTRYSEGVGALWPDPDFGGGNAGRGAAYAEMLKPEGPIVFAGEHLSYQPTWQEGAATSAHAALKLLHGMAAERPAMQQS